MNFKEIRLIGFKSFADKTAVKFDDGVTCIVGPNGCGKSNVADAVRWVLGEQSAKNLRGASMQDVIFNGTDLRRPLSFCEVTLVFDNADKMFDVEYAEVAMTRRLYRSGESEYLLNMQPCLRKDLIALFHGVGIGKEGYSIIGQGRVTQIMNSRPEERRAIFEEATGIMEYKATKAEIERKLDLSRDKLALYCQRIDEAKRTLDPLAKQAEEERKYREYVDKLKYEEVNTFLIRSDRFAQDEARYNGRIAAAEAELSQVEAQILLIDGKEASARLRSSEVDNELRLVNDDLRKYEVDNEHKSGEAKVMQERIKAYSQQRARATEDIADSERRSGEIDVLLDSGEKRLLSAEKRIHEIDKQLFELDARLAEADKRIIAHELETDETHASELSSAEQLADLRASQGSLSAQRDATQDRIGEINAAIARETRFRDEHARQLAEAEKQLKECKHFLDHQKEQEEEFDDEADALERGYRKYSEAITKAQNDISNGEYQLKYQLSVRDRSEGYREAVRRLRTDAKSDPALAKRMRGTIADLVHTDKQYEVAMETAFGGAMQSIVTETQRDAQQLIEYLRVNRIGTATFLPLDGMRPREDSRDLRRALSEKGAIASANDLIRYDEHDTNVIKNLIGNTLICENLTDATRIRNHFPEAFRIVTLDGDIIQTSGAMSGGHRSKEANLFSADRLIRESEDKIKQYRSELSRLTAALASCEKELAEARKNRDAFRLQVQQKTADFAALTQRVRALSDLVEERNATIKEYTDLLERLTRKASDLESEVLSSQENEELLRRIRSEAAEGFKLSSGKIETVREERAAILDRISKLKIESASLASSREADRQNAEKLKAEQRELAEKVKDMQASIASCEQKIAELEVEEARVGLSEEDRVVVEKLHADRDAIEAEKRQITEEQEKISAERSEAYARQNAVKEEIAGAKNEKGRAEVYLEQLTQRLQEGYDLTYETAQELRDPAYDFESSGKNIASLKRKIGELGNVNLTAIESYEELLARYNEMETQRADVDKGIHDLTDSLEDVKRRMKEQFDAGFNRINENFSTTFHDLFGGGRAEMQLDYEEGVDPLEAGVEIVACPPGKKLSKISLLSGGEQTLTSIAILFAILKSNPMPFCILDEIDAALDDVNVDRFAKYLKQFAQETQFIVITHRKPTMNQADTLFGVTMEEKGVSKIVSVKLSEVEKKLGGDTVM